jgi:hypothetical protein
MPTETPTPLFSPAEPARNRKFSVSDGMLLIAGLALAIAGGSKAFETLYEQCILLCQVIADYNNPRYVGRPEFWTERIASHWGSVVWYGFRVFQVLLLSMTPAFLLIRFRRPRPPLREMLKQPGTVAGLAVTFGYFWVTGWLHRLYFGRIGFHTGPAVAVGGTVIVAWAILALSRQWESEPSWVDRMGRLIGATAIVVAIVAYAKFGI